MEQPKHGIPIWFFIGGLLAVYGVLILGTGLYHLASPPEKPVALSHLHADIWWGAVLLGIGVIYCVKFRPSARETLTGAKE
jgi:hypothetical protein